MQTTKHFFHLLFASFLEDSRSISHQALTTIIIFGTRFYLVLSRSYGYEMLDGSVQVVHVNYSLMGRYQNSGVKQLTEGFCIMSGVFLTIFSER